MNKLITGGLVVVMALFAFLAFRTPAPVVVTVSPDALGASGTGYTHYQTENFEQGFTVSRGSVVGKQIKGTATYNPPSLADGVVATTTVTLTGALTSDVCYAGFTLYGTTGGINLTCAVSAADTALVTMDNESGVTQDNATGTLTVWSIR